MYMYINSRSKKRTGAIFRDSGYVKGLTTAAVIWASCAVGCMAGAGLYFTSIVLAVSCVSITVILKNLESFMDRFRREKLNEEEDK